MTRPRTVASYCVALVALTALSMSACGGRAARHVGGGVGPGSGGAATETDAGPALPPKLVQVAATPYGMQLALYDDGSVWFWWIYVDDGGAMATGSMGWLPGIGRATQIELDQLACALVDAGVKCGMWVDWISDFVPLPPAPVAGVADATRVAVGGTRGAARIADGSVQTWYIDWSTKPPGAYRLKTAVIDEVAALGSVKQIAMARPLFGSGAVTDLLCAANDAGTVTCFSLNLPGVAPKDVAGSRVVSLSPDVRLTSGTSSVCFVSSSTSVPCLEATDKAGSWIDITVDLSGAPSRPIAVELADNHRGSALLESGEVYATIERDSVTTETNKVIVRMQPLAGLGRASSIAVGGYASCGIVGSQVWCWGHEGKNAWQPMRVALPW